MASDDPRPALAGQDEPAEYAAVVAELTARWPEHRMEPDLARELALVTLLGDPQAAYPVIHVTGTNGKTSTARMIEALLRAFGLRTGLFTSPHLQDLRERILLDGEPVEIGRFLAAYAELRPYVDLVDDRSQLEGGPRMSFFEVLTGLALSVFADAPVDVAILEVGLGGAWDATNVADATVAVVTPIDLDHTELLGETAAQIAAEKAGIVKSGCVAVTAVQRPEVLDVLGARAAAVGATVLAEGGDFGIVRADLAVGGQLLVLRGQAGTYDDVFLPLLGAHQGQNAAVALAAVEAFLGDGRAALDAEPIREGFADVRSPGRLEVVRRSPVVVLDAAHNPHGARALAAAVAGSFDVGHLVGLVAVLHGKDAYGLLAALEPVLDEVVVTANSSPRCLDPDELAAVAVQVFGPDRVEVEPALDVAVETAIRLADESGAVSAGVLVTGSVVTVGDARRLLAPERSR